MPTSASDVELDLRAEISQLARDMVRLEQLAKDAADRHRWNYVATLRERRLLVQERRSDLMRELWRLRK